ncbi:uncharacterized protein LY79DRAFT_539079 [Colletotrichum navitas]|uniref:Uncharacterized protein n=1 Tax=Colletotrichum navitas TaxID=681940 RepID=A0AAD8Q9X1_9PEZI|nr:uncharacterized protein LY79DRAFT_539079 [Colletotrichum navitas]KAK1598405.1 hypothetical protein LY79DRAFT_539079 [Colletotrichum navitas]
MASTQYEIELRQPPGVARVQQAHNFPSSTSSPADVTHNGDPRGHRKTPSATGRPNDDETTIDAPLLSRQARSPGAIEGDSWGYEINRDGKYDQSSSPAEHTQCDGAGRGTSYREDQQATKSTLPGVNKTAKVPKQITRSSWTRHLNGWVVHIPAIVTTVAILCVGSIGFYWYPEEGPLVMGYRVDADTISNVLQLAAKLHELLIVASLSSIALSMFRRCLVTSGVRLGFLTGGYRVGDLGYIWTTAFRRQGLDTTSLWGILLPGFVVFATILSTAVGPASAVLLVPTLGWYKIDNSIAFGNITLPLKYARNSEDVWPPDRRDARSECKTVKGIYIDYCTAGGFPQISSWLLDFAATDLTNSLTFHSTSADLRRHIVFTHVNDTESTNSTTLLTTPPHFLTGSIGLFEKFIHSYNVGALSSEPRYRLNTTRANPENSQEESILYQPFVQSTCRVHDKHTLIQDKQPVFYPVESLNCFHDDDCENSQRNSVPFDDSWLTDPDLDVDVSISTSFLINKEKSSILFLNGQIPDDSSGESKDMVFLCSLIGSWAPSHFSVDAKVSDVLQSSLSQNSTMSELYRNTSTVDVRTLRFSRDWLDALTPSWYTTNKTNITALQQLVQTFSSTERHNGTTMPVSAPFSPDNKTGAEMFLSKVFGVYLTEGLAQSTTKHQKTRVVLNSSSDEFAYINLNEQHGFRRGEHRVTPLSSTRRLDRWRGKDRRLKGTFNEFKADFRKDLPIYIVAERHGYGSGQQRRTLHWAQATMGIYLGTVAIYALGVGAMSVLEFFEYEPGGVRVRVLSIVPWSDLQDLMILALKTPVPSDEDLADAGAGVTSSRVWKKTVRAGADDERNAQLVLGETETTRRLDLDGRERYY